MSTALPVQRSTRLSLADRWRRYVYLSDVEMRLDALTRRDRKSILKDLRTNLADASADVGMAQAIHDLGTAATLAREYQDSEPRLHPTWGIGLFAATVTFIALTWFTLTYWAGAVDTLSQLGGGSSTAYFFGLPVRLWADSGSLGAQINVGQGYFAWPQFAVVLLAYLLFARFWRLWVK